MTSIGPQGAFILGLDQGELRVWQAASPPRPMPKDDTGAFRVELHEPRRPLR